MSKKYVTISGDWIASIDDSRSVTSAELLSSDLFLISNPQLSNVDPTRTYECNGRTYTSRYKSANIRYNELSDQVFTDISTGFGVKSMAWELSDHYSREDHIHNYSALSVKPSIVPSASEIKNKEVSSIAVFLVNTHKHPVYVERAAIYNMPEPYIGQLKFLALSTLQNIPNTEEFYDSSDFTGWVYPDGRELDIQRFDRAYEAFGDTYGEASSGKFKIPNLTEFMLPYFPASYDKSLVETIPAQDVLLEHTHNIQNMQLSGSLTCTVSVGSVRDWSWSSVETAAQHSGSSSSKKQSYKFKVAFNCDNLQCDEENVKAAESELETYPQHVMLPTMIYVGGI